MPSYLWTYQHHDIYRLLKRLDGLKIPKIFGLMFTLCNEIQKTSGSPRFRRFSEWSNMSKLTNGSRFGPSFFLESKNTERGSKTANLLFLSSRILCSRLIVLISAIELIHLLLCQFLIDGKPRLGTIPLFLRIADSLTWKSGDLFTASVFA
jgi:hypothetical protein